MFAVCVAALLAPAVVLMGEADAQTKAKPTKVKSADALARRVLKETDFEYLGAFALPKSACKHSTAFGATGLAVRRVHGKLRLITGSHRYSKDALYEVTVPGWGKVPGKWPQAPIVSEWGTKPYVEAKLNTKHGPIWAHGLYWDEDLKRLYYSFASWYNTAGNTPCLAYATLGDTPKPYGPWKSSRASTQKVRGGSLRIPKWFADKYTRGRSLGIGFGGYYSIWGPGSKGPHLSAVRHPTKEKPGSGLDTMVLVDYPATGPKEVLKFARRNPDYQEQLKWSPGPKGKVGYWTGMDEIFGACVWIDLPDKHGLLYVASLGHGRVWYEGGDRFAEKVKGWWFVYDPRSLAEVALGRKNPWQHSPASWQVNYEPQPGGKWTTPGCTFDPESRTLFLLVPGCYQSGVEWYPLVHGWKVKK
jgi:hypothetical protein